MRGRIVALATVAACLVVSAPASANYLTNGGFESPDIPTGSWANFASIPGWTPINGCGIEVQDNVAGAPAEGGQFVELNSHCKSGIRTTVYPHGYPTDLYPSMKVEWRFSPRPGTPSSLNSMEVRWNGQVVDREGLIAAGSTTNWWSGTVMVPAPTYPAQLEFRSTSLGESGAGSYLDDVRVTKVLRQNYWPAPTTPGPSCRLFPQACP
jgi:hypothetical protein